MNKPISLGLASLLVAGYASADGLYYVGGEAQESMPLKWVVGADLTWDDNVTPSTGNREEATSINPYVGLSVVSITPQTTWDVYARLGLIYYIDAPESVDSTYGQARLGFNLNHRFSERLRLSSRNFVSYELEPDYSYGFATDRQLSEYFYWQTDNAIGYRWTERFATYTGFILSGLDYGSEVQNSDRFSWTLYNQFRYQLSPQSVLTFDYRYTDTTADGDSEDSTDQYLLAGIEHRFSPNSILIVKAGAQLREVEGGDDSTNPFLELATTTRVNEKFTVRAFARYSVESYDTFQVVENGDLSDADLTNDNTSYDFSERQTLRIGVSAEYAISPMLAIFGGVDYIPSTFDGGEKVAGPVSTPESVDGFDEDIINAYIGLSMKFTDYLTGTLTYNFTDSSSDFAKGDYDRNRVSVGVRAEF